MFGVVINARSTQNSAHSITGYYTFEMGKVPDFVYSDTNWVLKKNLNNRSFKKLSSLQKKKLISWLFLLPSLIGVMLFFVAPFGVVIYYSLINNPIQKEFVGFKNYVNVWRNAAFQQAASNTLMFSLMAVPMAVVLSLFLAAVMESRIPFKSSCCFFR